MDFVDLSCEDEQADALASDTIIEPKYSADLLHAARSANALIPAVMLTFKR